MVADLPNCSALGSMGQPNATLGPAGATGKISCRDPLSLHPSKPGT